MRCNSWPTNIKTMRPSIEYDLIAGGSIVIGFGLRLLLLLQAELVSEKAD